MSINYNPHNDSHLLLLQDYFPAVRIYWNEDPESVRWREHATLMWTQPLWKTCSMFCAKIIKAVNWWHYSVFSKYACSRDWQSYVIFLFLSEGPYSILASNSEESVHLRGWGPWRSSWPPGVAGVLEGRQCAHNNAFGSVYHPLTRLAVELPYQAVMQPDLCSRATQFGVRGSRGGETHNRTVWAGKLPGEKSQCSIRFCSWAQ
jgi:hypothetical protein